MNTLIVIESLTIVNLLNKVQFPFVKVFPPQMLSSSSEGAIVQAVPIAFAPLTPTAKCSLQNHRTSSLQHWSVIVWGEHPRWVGAGSSRTGSQPIINALQSAPPESSKIFVATLVWWVCWVWGEDPRWVGAGSSRTAPGSDAPVDWDQKELGPERGWVHTTTVSQWAHSVSWPVWRRVATRIIQSSWFIKYQYEYLHWVLVHERVEIEWMNEWSKLR